MSKSTHIRIDSKVHLILKKKRQQSNLPIKTLIEYAIINLPPIKKNEK